MYVCGNVWLDNITKYKTHKLQNKLQNTKHRTKYLKINKEKEKLKKNNKFLK